MLYSMEVHKILHHPQIHMQMAVQMNYGLGIVEMVHGTSQAFRYKAEYRCYLKFISKQPVYRAKAKLLLL